MNVTQLMNKYYSKTPKANALSLPVVKSERQDTQDTLSQAGVDNSASLSGKELQNAARQWVSKNTAQEDADEEGKLFPPADSGNGGVDSYLLEGDAAEKVVDFAEAISMDDIPFDSSKEAIIAVATSEDEEDLFVNIMDRGTGEARNVADGELGMVDYSSYIEEDKFQEFFPPADFPELIWEEAGEYEIIDALMAGGTDLRTNPEIDYKAMDARNGSQSSQTIFTSAPTQPTEAFIASPAGFPYGS